MKNRIAEWRKRRYLTMEKLAELLGTDASTINKLEKGKLRLSDKWIAPLCEALKISPGDLFGDTSDWAAESPQAPTQKMTPVFGLAAGSLAGAPFMSPEPVDWIAAPPALANARSAYALLVTGGSMEPRYFSGDVLYIAPHKPVRPGDHVIVQIRRDHVQNETWVKRYRGEEKDHIVTEQYNPASTIRFKREHVGAVHRILTVNELFGL